MLNGKLNAGCCDLSGAKMGNEEGHQIGVCRYVYVAIEKLYDIIFTDFTQFVKSSRECSTGNRSEQLKVL